MQHDDFVHSLAARKRYWSRSLRGWGPFSGAQPNAGHSALARLDRSDMLLHTVTQNVDGLHQRAGSLRVSELHGSAHAVRCLSCGATSSRQHMQNQLHALNYWWVRKTREQQAQAELRADGDADLVLLDEDERAFRIPPCSACGGVLKTDVTFFGDTVPAELKASTLAFAREADGVLVVGTSLMVLSAFRLVETAAAHGAPVAVVNLGEPVWKRRECRISKWRRRAARRSHVSPKTSWRDMTGAGPNRCPHVHRTLWTMRTAAETIMGAEDRRRRPNMRRLARNGRDLPAPGSMRHRIAFLDTHRVWIHKN